VRATDQTEKLLSYEDKYMKGGKVKGMASLSRLVPAPISKVLAEKSGSGQNGIQSGGRQRNCQDRLFGRHQKEKYYINEINTLPGSLAFYLWEKSGYPFPK